MPKERELFEKWARRARWRSGGLVLSVRDLTWDKTQNQYKDYIVDVAYQAFLGGLKAKGETHG
ncbi:MAG: hypothetical protein PHY29_02875 [Syntrophales bacterium]|nr:hypothetical protein [Syntrophales bacterium]